MNIAEQKAAGHLALLTEKVFAVNRKWPQFKLLLADCAELAAQMPAGSTIVSLERTLLYGGISLFAPLFHRQRYLAVDCSPASADTRGAYNRTMVDDPRCVSVPFSLRGQPEATGLPDATADLLLIPNLVHHVADQRGMFAEIHRVLKPGGRGYIFEPLVRELHQAPDDYLRYTPFGMERMIAEAGMVYDRYVPVGGPFTAVAYCWQQALEYFPEAERVKMEQWFEQEHLPQLLAWEAAHPLNLKRKHTSFPTAFAVHFHNPA